MPKPEHFEGPDEYWAATDEFGIWHVFCNDPMNPVARLPNGIDSSARDKLVGRLNKGTHFDDLLKAAKSAVVLLGDVTQTADEGDGTAYVYGDDSVEMVPIIEAISACEELPDA